MASDLVEVLRDVMMQLDDPYSTSTTPAVEDYALMRAQAAKLRPIVTALAEQARLNGMGSEREARQKALIHTLERRIRNQRAALRMDWSILEMRGRFTSVRRNAELFKRIRDLRAALASIEAMAAHPTAHEGNHLRQIGDMARKAREGGEWAV